LLVPVSASIFVILLFLFEMTLPSHKNLTQINVILMNLWKRLHHLLIN